MLLLRFLWLQGNFNSKRGAAAVSDRFPDKRFTAVLLDYFRCVGGAALCCQQQKADSIMFLALKLSRNLPKTTLHLVPCHCMVLCVYKQPLFQAAAVCVWSCTC